MKYPIESPVLHNEGRHKNDITNVVAHVRKLQSKSQKVDNSYIAILLTIDNYIAESDISYSGKFLTWRIGEFAEKLPSIAILRYGYPIGIGRRQIKYF